MGPTDDYYRIGNMVVAIVRTSSSSDNFYSIDKQGSVTLTETRDKGHMLFGKLNDSEKNIVVTDKLSGKTETGLNSTLNAKVNANVTTEMKQGVTTGNQNSISNVAQPNQGQLVVVKYSGSGTSTISVTNYDKRDTRNLSNLERPAGTLPTPVEGQSAQLPANSLPANLSQNLQGVKIPVTDSNGNIVRPRSN
jgi:hypothetical protein